MKKLTAITTVALAVALLMSCLSLTLFANTQDPVMSITHCNLSYRDAVCIKYAVKLENTTEAKLLIWTSERSDYTYGTQSRVLEATGTQTIGGEKRTVFDYTGVNAKQMAEAVYARAYVKVGSEEFYSDVVKYSVMQYAYNSLGKTGAGSSNEKVKTLMRNLLQYGAAVQDALGYSTDRLATDDFYQVKLSAGQLSDTCNHGLYLEGDKITLKAPETDANGVKFSHWIDSEGNAVSTDAEFELTVVGRNEEYTPVYDDSTFYVIFKDHDGTPLKTQVMKEGQEALPPEIALRKGYDFIGWDKELSGIKENTTLSAQYEKAHNQLFFEFADNGDGTAKATLTLAGDVRLYGLEMSITPQTGGMEFESVSALAPGLMANMKNSSIIVSYAATSGMNVTQETPLLEILFTYTGENPGVYLEAAVSDAFDQSFNNESCTVAGNEYNP